MTNDTLLTIFLIQDAECRSVKHKLVDGTYYFFFFLNLLDFNLGIFRNLFIIAKKL